MENEIIQLNARRKSRPIHVGDVQIGGDAPVVVQTMTNTDTADAKSTLNQVHKLADEGAEIVRVAVPDKQAAAALPEIVKGTAVPLIADIHFDPRLAHAAVKAGVHALRLNPGNIRDADKVREVVWLPRSGDPYSSRSERGVAAADPQRLPDGEMPPSKTQRMSMLPCGRLESWRSWDSRTSRSRSRPLTCRRW